MAPDQLYDLKNDPGEQRNLVDDPKLATTLDAMIASMKSELKRFENRPYGELIPGSDTSDREAAVKVLKKLRSAAVEKNNPKNRTRGRATE